MTKPLSASVKSDRSEMARQIEELATLHGATVKRTEGGTYPGPRAIHLGITGARGLEVTVQLDGGSRNPDSFLLSWHMHLDSKALLKPVFGGVNDVHYSKATHSTNGFPGLVEAVDRGLKMAADGSAFFPQEEADAIVAAGKARYAAMVSKNRPQSGP